MQAKVNSALKGLSMFKGACAGNVDRTHRAAKADVDTPELLNRDRLSNYLSHSV